MEARRRVKARWTGGKQGIKRSVAVDAEGIPLGVIAAPANRHDSPLLSETLHTVGELPELCRYLVALETETVDRQCPKCGKGLLMRYGKFGKFLACSGFPECKHTEPLEEILDVKCPKDDGDIVLRKTKKGRPFYGCKNYPKCDFASWNRPVSSTEDTKVVAPNSVIATS